MTIHSTKRLAASAPGTGTVLRAGGAPLDAAVAEAAADWFTRLHGGTATAAEQKRWRQWHDATFNAPDALGEAFDFTM